MSAARFVAAIAVVVLSSAGCIANGDAATSTTESDRRAVDSAVTTVDSISTTSTPRRNIVVSGMLTVDYGNRFSYYADRPVELEQGARGTVEIHRIEGGMADLPGVLMLRREFDVDEFPTAYEVAGTLELDPADEYFVTVYVSIDGDADSRVGDLVNDVLTELPEVGAVVDIELTGMEPCDAPNAGGFCADLPFPSAPML